MAPLSNLVNIEPRTSHIELQTLVLLNDSVPIYRGGSVKTAKSITQVKDKRRHHDPHKLAFFVVNLLLYLLSPRNELKDATPTKAPTTPNLLPRN